MSAERVRDSVIVADCGIATTRVVLLEQVESAFRFVAQGEHPSTLEAPGDDLSEGLTGALSALETAAARRLLARNRLIVPQDENGDGVDALLATVASTPPLLLALLATGSSALINALLDVARRAPVTALATVTLDSADLDDQIRESLQAIARHQPDLLLLVADGNTPAVVPALLRAASEVVTAGAIQGIATPPAILFVGEERWHPEVTATFGGGAELGLIDAASSPSSESAAVVAAVVEQELLDFANRRAREARAGFAELAASSATPPLARGRALELVNRFMAIHFGVGVLTVDFDDGASFCWASGAEHATLTEPALDLGLGAANLLTTLTLADVLRWLPFGLSEDELASWVLNRAVRPFTIPLTARDRAIEMALARELLRTGADELRSANGQELTPDLVVGGRFFARWPHPALAMLALIDGLAPSSARGLVQLALDSDGLLPAIGVLGVIDPGQAVEVFDHDGLIDLGAYVGVSGVGGEPRDEVRGEIEYASGVTQRFTVPAGSLLRLPLGQGERATRLRVEPGAGATLGNEAPGVGVTYEGLDAPHGGLVGLVIDARGRPLALPRDEQERIAAITRWAEAL